MEWNEAVMEWNGAAWNANGMDTGMYVINAEFNGTNISHNVSLIK